MKRPLAALTIFFCLGICLGRFWYIPFLFLYLLVCISLILSFIFVKYRTSTSLLFILPSHHIRNFSFYKSGPVLIKGVVTSLPETKPNRSSFILSVEELTPLETMVQPEGKKVSLTGLSQTDKVYSVSGKVLVRVFNKEKTFQYGDNLLLEGRLYRPFSFSREEVSEKLLFNADTRPVRNTKNFQESKISNGARRCNADIRRFYRRDNLRPSAFDLRKSAFKILFQRSREFNYRDYLKHRGIYCILSVKKNNLVKQLGRNTGNPLKSLAFRLRNKIKEAISKNLSFFSASILNAIILGDRQDLSFYVRNALLKSGTVHILPRLYTKMLPIAL